MGTVAAAAPSSDLRQAQFAKPDLRRFLLLCGELVLVLVCFYFARLERPAFFTTACLVFGGFAVAYWLPFRYKQPFVILLSLASAFLLLGTLIAGMLIGAGLFFFVLIRSPLAFRWKVVAMLAVAAVLAYGRATGRFPIPEVFWPVFGGIFMFRMINYLYDIGSETTAPRLDEFLSYFYLLPNYYFIVFPLVDFQTMRDSYFRRDFYPVAQQGIWWIVRGITHLALYRGLVLFQQTLPPAGRVALGWIMYIQLSGQFHIIVGMLHLFGYDLPETNHRYLLASSFSDLWRRNNIYWKDFMLKLVYLPAYFKLRRSGDLRAQLMATGGVFAVSWFLHAYQMFWFEGRWGSPFNDILFWFLLGSIVVWEVWRTNRRGKGVRGTRKTVGWRHVVQVVATFSIMTALWPLRHHSVSSILQSLTDISRVAAGLFNHIIGR